MPRVARNTDYNRLRRLKQCIGDEGYISNAVSVLATDLSIRLVQLDETGPESHSPDDDGALHENRSFHGE